MPNEPRRRSLNRTDTGRSALVAGTALQAPFRTLSGAARNGAGKGDLRRGRPRFRLATPTQTRASIRLLCGAIRLARLKTRGDA